LLIGSILGLTQVRIKRLFAYSTISHVGFILLALSINSIESIQAFLFYLIQYSITNLNAFIILASIGYSLYYYTNSKEEFKQLEDKNNSPIQLISQIKGYFYINPVLSISLTITIFSFAGIPPLIGFFAKQMVLSAALDSGYIFMALIAILTSVISAVYYLNVIKQVFFYKPDYSPNPDILNINIHASILKNKIRKEKLTFKMNNIVLSSYLTITISILTISITMFILTPNEINISTLVSSLSIFNT
jgi:NADH-ubiquinone oxidoreductase chain 2